MYLPVYVLTPDPGLRASVRKALDALQYGPVLEAALPTPEWPLPGLAIVDARREQAFNDALAALGERLGSRLPPVVAVLAGAPTRFPREADDFFLATDVWQQLAARLRFVVMRAHAGEGERYLRAGRLAVNLSGCQAALDGHPLDLTLKEYQLLAFLMGRPGRAFTREQLLSEVWGYDYYGGTRTVDVHVRRLRAKIGDFAESTVATVRGVGYRFDPPVEDLQAP